MKKVLFCLFALVLVAPLAWGEIYKRENADGSISFSDQPMTGGDAVKLRKPNVFKEKNAPEKKPNSLKVNQDPKKEGAAKQAEKAKPAKPVEPEFVGYKSFSLDSPVDGKTFQNQRNLSVSFSINPELRPGDKIQLKVDGQPFGDPVSSSSVSVHNLNRGQHTLQGDVIDKTGRVMISSNSVVVYIHYAALGGG